MTEDSPTDTEALKPTETTVEVIKAKKPRSDKQLEVLKKAREKAFAVRAEQTELRKKEREIDAKKKADEKAMRKQKVEEEHSKMKEDVMAFTKGRKGEFSSTFDKVVEEDVQVESVQKVKKPVRRKVVVVESDTSEEEVEIHTKRRKQPQPEDSVADRMYQQTYSKMFD